MSDEYWEVYKASAAYDLENGAYDENENVVYCDCCGEPLRWDPQQRWWVCSSCGNTKNRAQYFSYICANPPGDKCMTCMENYPRCKIGCLWYDNMNN